MESYTGVVSIYDGDKIENVAALKFLTGMAFPFFRSFDRSNGDDGRSDRSREIM